MIQAHEIALCKVMIMRHHETFTCQRSQFFHHSDPLGVLVHPRCFASLPGLPLQHADERHRFQEALAEAHRTALDCSMEDDAATTAPTSCASPRSSGAVHFATFLHLIRSYLESIKQKHMQREEAALRWCFFVVFLRGAKSDTSQLKVFDNELRFLMTANYRNQGMYAW